MTVPLAVHARQTAGVVNSLLTPCCCCHALPPLPLQVYPGCDPNAHSCSTNPELEDEASRASDEAAINLINSL